MQGLGKLLIIIGIIIAVAGIFLYCQIKIPYIGKLPGDIHIKKENYSFYFPVTTSIIVSIILSLLLWLFSKK